MMLAKDTGADTQILTLTWEEVLHLREQLSILEKCSAISREGRVKGSADYSVTWNHEGAHIDLYYNKDRGQNDSEA